MTRPRFYPCQTEDGRTYVMRSSPAIGVEPVIVREISGTFDTTERWRIARGLADKANAQHTQAMQEAAVVWRIILAIVVAVGIVAAFMWGN